ncbi:MAG: UDP-N-acetylmuramoyl-tripeptide--D-alanyl-D-alanine ligase [Chthoniobacterales bacterium]|nr:UDP-N-acetylmuramoyl-tripeptide--D-alanyl-D-alanine ligase [Chthoniobacterales bacterium]
MDPISLSQIAAWSGAEILSGNREALISGVSHDTRGIKEGELYIALRGEYFDGNSFIKEASKKGALGVLCDRTTPQDLPSNFGVLRVTDTFHGLTSLATAWRRELGLRSVVLTGSNGKTSTKDFTAALLSFFLKVTSTQGNYNNHIGLPLSILRASKGDRVAVWEIGMNHAGEIAPLAAIAKPDIGIITNIGTAHIGFLGSREAIAQEKGNLLVELAPDGLAILPAADDFCDLLASRTQARILRVGIGTGDLQATHLVPLTQGMQFQVSYQGVSLPGFLPVIGAHMVHNALFALAVGLECGISFQEGVALLEKLQPSQSRLQLYQLGGITLVDDCYNASPDSMEAALNAIVSLKGSRRIALLGCMGELGDYTMQGYTRVGLKAAELVDLLIVVSHETLPLAEVARDAGMKEVYHVSDNNEAIKLVSSLLRSGDILLIKGSKRAHLNKVAEAVRVLCQQQEFPLKDQHSASLPSQKKLIHNDAHEISGLTMT